MSHAGFERELESVATRPRASNEDPSLLNYLNEVWEHCHRFTGIYDVVLLVSQESRSWNNIDRGRLQQLSSALSNFPALLQQFSDHLPCVERFELSADFALTGAMRIFSAADRSTVYWCAAFGLSDNQPLQSDDKILRLLRSTMRWREREQAVITLAGVDAQRMLALIQKILQSEQQWNTFARETQEDYSLSLEQEHQRRLHRMLIKLAVASNQWPPSLCLEAGSVGLTFQYPVQYGGFADIYEGTWRGVRVAVKRLKVFSMLSAEEDRLLKKQLYSEALIWAKLDHRHVIRFLGVCNDLFHGGSTEHIHSIVVPWAERGNIRDCMSKSELGKGQIETWLQQIVNGLDYLHKNKIVHGDLRGANILIDSNSDVKLADFGISILVRTASTTAATHLPDGGAARWMAPELHRDIPLIDASGSAVSSGEEVGFELAPMVDIYSFACTCVELYSRSDPQFDGVPAAGRAVNYLTVTKVLQGERPSRPRGQGREMTDALWALLQRCWQQSPDNRPQASEVSEMLVEIMGHDQLHTM